MIIRHRFRNSAIGLVGLTMFAAIICLSLALYGQVFTASVPLTIHADRAGLLMEPGAEVKLHGVVVGQVRQVSSTGSGARITVGLDPKMIERIPAGVSADVVPPTVFGAKYVDLVPPRSARVSEHIEPGAVIGPAQVTVEINTTFDAVMAGLRNMPPGQLNAALTSVATAMRGRGAQFGRLIDQADAYLRQFNPTLPVLSADLPLTGHVSNLYNDVAPGFIRTGTNTGTLSDTLVAQQAQFAAFLLSFTELGNTTADAFTQLQQVLPTTLTALLPTVQIFSTYSPELPCLFKGLVRNDQLLSATAHGAAASGTDTLAGSLPPYQYPQDLPVVGASGPPDCHGLPVVNSIVPFVNYNVGTHPYRSNRDGTSLSEVPVVLFGQPVSVPRAGGQR